jgi:hypothetical protein
MDGDSLFVAEYFGCIERERKMNNLLKMNNHVNDHLAFVSLCRLRHSPAACTFSVLLTFWISRGSRTQAMFGPSQLFETVTAFLSLTELNLQKLGVESFPLLD